MPESQAQADFPHNSKSSHTIHQNITRIRSRPLIFFSSETSCAGPSCYTLHCPPLLQVLHTEPHLKCPTAFLIQSPKVYILPRSMVRPSTVIPTPGTNFCLSQTSVAVSRHYDHTNSYKRKHLSEECLKFRRFSALLSWWEACQHISRHGAGKVPEHSPFRLAGSRERQKPLAWPSETPKASPSDILPPTKPYLL